MEFRLETGFFDPEAVKDGRLWEDSIPFRDFEQNYQPRINYLDESDPDAITHMFGLSKAEVDFVNDQEVEQIWTHVKGDFFEAIVAGKASNDVSGYYVCDRPWERGTEQVLISVELECDCNKSETQSYPRSHDGQRFGASGDPECDGCSGEGRRTAFAPVVSRAETEGLYDRKLTDRQWEILQEEIAGKEEWESIDEIVEEVMENLESYEDEHNSWGSQD